MPRFLPFAGLVLALTALSFAAQATDCRESATTQAEINRCADEEFQSTNDAMNEAYKTLSQKVSPAGLEKLRVAQRAWQAYREAQCEFNTFGSADASAHPSALADCYTQQTEMQRMELESQLACEEGDLGCGGQ